jgi:hypothetical protein
LFLINEPTLIFGLARSRRERSRERERSSLSRGSPCCLKGIANVRLDDREIARIVLAAFEDFSFPSDPGITLAL